MDIKSAPKRVKDAYSTYWNLKTDLLQASLIDATFDENAKDCFTSPPPRDEVNSCDVTKTVLSDLTVSLTSPSLPIQSSEEALTGSINFKSVLNSGEKSFKLDSNSTLDDSKKFLPEPDKEKIRDNKFPLTQINENTTETSDNSVWGPHLSIKRPSSVRSLSKRSISFQYSEKLFAKAKFTNRNPRKSFRRNKTCDSLPVSGDSNSTVGISLQVYFF